MADAGIVARTVASPEPTSSANARCTSSETYCEFQSMICCADYASTAQLRQAILQFLEPDRLLGHVAFHLLDDVLRSAAAKSFIRKLVLLGLNGFREPIYFLLEPCRFSRNVDDVGIRNSQVKLSRRTD